MYVETLFSALSHIQYTTATYQRKQANIGDPAVNNSCIWDVLMRKVNKRLASQWEDMWLARFCQPQPVSTVCSWTPHNVVCTKWEVSIKWGWSLKVNCYLKCESCGHESNPSCQNLREMHSSSATSTTYGILCVGKTQFFNLSNIKHVVSKNTVFISQTFRRSGSNVDLLR